MFFNEVVNDLPVYSTQDLLQECTTGYAPGSYIIWSSDLQLVIT